MSEIIVPLVHMNGTDRRSLQEVYQAAYAGILAAEKLVAASHPNGRDYYILGPDAIRVAEDQHRSRLARLTEIRAEFVSILEKLEG